MTKQELAQEALTRATTGQSLNSNKGEPIKVRPVEDKTMTIKILRIHQTAGITGEWIVAADNVGRALSLYDDECDEWERLEYLIVPDRCARCGAEMDDNPGLGGVIYLICRSCADAIPDPYSDTAKSLGLIN